MSKLINLTPHRIWWDTSAVPGGYQIPASGTVARVNTNNQVLPGDLVRQTIGEVTCLPAPVPGVRYVVSRMVLDASNRTDLLCPDTGPGSVIRDADGNILGVKRMVVK